LKADYQDFTELDLSSNYTVDLNNSIAIADALASNTHLRSLKMCSLRLTNAFAKALARYAMTLCVSVLMQRRSIRVNNTLVSIDLEDNKLDSDGIEEIASALAHNKSILEINLFKNRYECARVRVGHAHAHA
jgi:Ran GTPase-activating protein (RanGAP) involved in mRNA processing and transport